MALYKLILAYDGTDYSGFQRQGKNRTVQGEIEKTLREVGWSEKALLFAGRTDAGVHASGQVVVFKLDWQHSSADLLNALNARLPQDCAVREISLVEAEFHPRYDATCREYCYHVYPLAVRHPLFDRYAGRIWPQVDLIRLNQAASLFIGRHDFKAFGRAMKKGGSTIREVFQSRWIESDFGYDYVVGANAFLYHMVRRLVYVQVRFAQKGLTLSDLEQALTLGKPIKPGLAPANGLVLTRVDYSGNRSGFCEDEEN
jgi:tRNA pseudouridine38-40 synthase